MKKVFFISVIALIATLNGYAQKTTVNIQDTQARALDVTPNTYVNPLTVELRIDKDEPRINHKLFIDNKQVADMQGLTLQDKIVNMRAYAVYAVSELKGCDVIVAPVFNIRTVDGGYEVHVKGFKGYFTNWKTATPADYQWMQLDRTITTADRNQIEAVVKPVTK